MNEFEPSPLRTTPFCKLSNKTFLRSILSDPDLKRRTMHACNEHRVCRQRHTYTHACTHIHKHTNTYIYIYIATEGRNTLPRRTHFCLPGKLREHERKRKERCKATVSPSRSIFLPIDRSSPSYRAKYRTPTCSFLRTSLKFLLYPSRVENPKPLTQLLESSFSRPFHFFSFLLLFFRVPCFRSLFAVSRSLAFENAFEKGGT